VRSNSWPQRLAIPDTVQLEAGFSRDVRSIGHFGTGDLELRIKDADGFAKAQPLILPALFVVVIGPAAIRTITLFAHMAGN
jgi:hypothetical protein